MTEDSKPADRLNQHFRFGLPAAIVGLSSVLLIAYGVWLQPERLPNQYEAALEAALVQYDQALDDTDAMTAEDLFRFGSRIDVIYRRLQSLGSQSSQWMWQRAKFQKRHIDQIRRLNLKSDTASNNKLKAQMALFQGLSRELTQTAAADNPEWKIEAKLSSTATVIESKELTHDLVDSETVRMQELLANKESDPAQKIRAARLSAMLVSQRPWFNDGPLRLSHPDLRAIEQALETIDAIASKAGAVGDVVIDTIRAILLAQTDSAEAASLAEYLSSVKRDSFSNSKIEDDGLVALVEIQLFCVLGDWREVSRLLNREFAAPTVDSNFSRREVTTTICRLAISSLPDDQSTWGQRLEEGLRIALKIDGSSPGLAELVWDASRRQDGVQSSERLLDPEVLRTLRLSPRSEFRMLVSMVAAVRTGNTDQVGDEIRKGRLVSADLPSTFAHHALWHLARSDRASENGSTAPDFPQAEWVSALVAVTKEADQSGLAWYACAAFQLRAGQFAQAEVSLGNATRLLGDIPAIDQLARSLETKQNGEQTP